MALKRFIDGFRVVLYDGAGPARRQGENERVRRGGVLATYEEGPLAARAHTNDATIFEVEARRGLRPVDASVAFDHASSRVHVRHRREIRVEVKQRIEVHFRSRQRRIEPRDIGAR